MKYSRHILPLAIGGLPLLANAQSSCGPAPSGSIRPSVASGYRLQVVATGLARPRGLALDTNGNLLVVQQGVGSISAHTFNETNGCLTLANTQNVTGSNMELNHGIEISTDGRTLYASSNEYVYSWDYDPDSMSISNQQTLISNMTGSDHATRTLLLSRRAPGMLSVARGSTSNIDMLADSIDTGISQVKAFNITDQGREGDRVYNYNVDGTRLGWGLRNEVGIGEHPISGGIWGVENSADQQTRMGVDIHADNPAEELNFLGYVNGTVSAQQGGNFGYPWCFTAWDVAALPNNENLTVGSQYAIDATASSNNRNQTDQYCAQQIAPRLAFQAHMAPLDIKFNDSGTEAWITFHGSWNRAVPVGYKLSVVSFSSAGEPTQPSNSTTAALDIVSNADLTRCPSNCFRPVAMAIDAQGRVFMSSDSSGEIYLITREPGSSGTSSQSPSPSGMPTSTGTSTGSSSSSSANAAPGFIKQANFGGLRLYQLGAYLTSIAMLLF